MSVLEAKGDAVRASGQWSIAIGEQPIKPVDSRQVQSDLARSQKFKDGTDYEEISLAKPAHMLHATINRFSSQASALFEKCRAFFIKAEKNEVVLVDSESQSIEASRVHLVHSNVKEVRCDAAYLVGSEVSDLRCNSMLYTPDKTDFGKILTIRAYVSRNGKLSSVSIGSEPIEKPKPKKRYFLCFSPGGRKFAVISLAAALSAIWCWHYNKSII